MRWPSLVALCAAASVAQADPATDAGRDVRDRARAQIAAERAAVGRAAAAVDDKRAVRADQRNRRARAAYKVLRAGAPPWAEPEVRMGVARRRAAARHLLARDRAEVSLLAGEAAQLDLAAARLGVARAVAEVAPVPSFRLDWPASPGHIKATRPAGTFVHAPSRAVLSQRGLEIEVIEASPAVAMADGVIRYVGPIRGLDGGVVIDHGAVVSITARLADLRRAPGDAVRRGDEIGRAAHRNIYVELRLPLGPGGVPLDPETLLAPRRSSRKR